MARAKLTVDVDIDELNEVIREEFKGQVKNIVRSSFDSCVKEEVSRLIKEKLTTAYIDSRINSIVKYILRESFNWKTLETEKMTDLIRSIIEREFPQNFEKKVDLEVKRKFAEVISKVQ